MPAEWLGPRMSSHRQSRSGEGASIPAQHEGSLKSMSDTVKVAILDDYQNCALRMADWSVLPANVETTVFTDNEPDFDRLIQRLMPFQVVCAMRERTRFDREVMEKLQNLKLIATTGAWNAAIDMEAAEE